MYVTLTLLTGAAQRSNGFLVFMTPDSGFLVFMTPDSGVPRFYAPRLWAHNFYCPEAGKIKNSHSEAG